MKVCNNKNKEVVTREKEIEDTDRQF